MKNSKKIFGLATMLLAVTGMVACGGPSNEGGSSTAGGKDHVCVADTAAGYQTNGTKHWYKCTDSTCKKHVDEANHTLGDEVTTKEADCTNAGEKKAVCSVCNYEKKTTIAAKGHTFGEVVWESTPDCTNPGKGKKTCSTCKTEEEVTENALGHKFEKAEDQTGARTPTCVNSGSVIEKCTNPGCEEVRKVEVAATGHKYGEAVETAKAGDQVAFKKEVCTEDNAVRYSWSAGDVTAACKENPHNVVEKNNGYQFWGQPKGNAVVLNNDGDASSDAHEAIFDATVEGSYFEFKFNAPEAIKNAQLCAEFTPAQYLDSNGGLFIAAPNGDWTPGMVGEDKFIDDFRYEILVDGTKVELTKEDNEAAHNRAWYNFPLKQALNLTAGEHTIKVVMTGGWKHTFYNFGLAMDGDHSAEAYVAKFVGLEHASLFEYMNNDYQKDETQKAKFVNVDFLYSRSKSGGDFGAFAKKDLDEEGKVLAQWNFKIVPEEGYVVESVTEDVKNFKNIKGPADLLLDNTYSCTQVKGDVTFTVVVKKAA